MIMKFKAAVDRNGNTRFLAVDTEKKQYATLSREIYPDAAVVKVSTIIYVKACCIEDGFTRVDFM